ncbi:MAG: redoxin domain-containing protein [Akkermansiaceae bacterium]
MRLLLTPILAFFWMMPTRAQTVVPDITLVDLQGQPRSLSRGADKLPLALVFLGHECPVSNAAIPALNQLAKEMNRKVTLLGISSDATLTRLVAAKHFKEYQLTIPVLFDASGLLARALQPTHVPEAFVFSPDRQLAYRGALNNAFNEVGRRRAKVEKHYLAEAIKAVVAGQKPALKFVKPVGCFFETLPQESEKGAVTYSRDIAPILNARCVRCHRDGQAAPFALDSFQSAAKRGRQMLRVVHEGLMPPWMPTPGAQPRFVGDRSMTTQEKELLEQWVKGGRAEGNPADRPPAPTFPENWELGKPDLILRMTESFKVPADGPDILQNLVIPVKIPEDKMVRAIEFRPGNKRVVHHSVLFLDDKGQARKLDAETPEPGYSNFGGAGFLPSGSLGGWSVGNTARELPKGMGRYLKKGSDLVMQIHYHPTGKAEVDQSEVAVYFIDQPVEEILAEPGRLVSSFWLSDYLLEIPAEEKSYESKASYTLPRDITLVGLVPHMHLLGRSVKVTATPPKGPPRTLVDIPEWNYNWQDEFYYEEPFPLPAGTKIEVVATFDNSNDNPSNPSNPPKKVTWGDGTLDEMMFCFFLFSGDSTEDIIHTTLHNLGHDLKQPRLEKK